MSRDGVNRDEPVARAARTSAVAAAPGRLPPPIVDDSGGVGELLYARVRGQLAATTASATSASTWRGRLRRRRRGPSIFALTRRPLAGGRRSMTAPPQHADLRQHGVLPDPGGFAAARCLPILGRIGLAAPMSMCAICWRWRSGVRAAAGCPGPGRRRTEELRRSASRLAQHLTRSVFQLASRSFCFTTRNVGQKCWAS